MSMLRKCTSKGHVKTTKSPQTENINSSFGQFTSPLSKINLQSPFSTTTVRKQPLLPSHPFCNHILRHTNTTSSSPLPLPSFFLSLLFIFLSLLTLTVNRKTFPAGSLLSYRMFSPGWPTAYYYFLSLLH